MTPSGIKPVTFWLWAWCPNQLCHHVPPWREREKKKAIIGQHTCYLVYQINPAFCDVVHLLLSAKELICVSIQYSCIYMPSREKIHKLHRYYSIYKMIIHTADSNFITCSYITAVLHESENHWFWRRCQDRFLTTVYQILITSPGEPAGRTRYWLLHTTQGTVSHLLLCSLVSDGHSSSTDTF